MFDRIRQAALLVVGCIIGFELGSGPLAEWAGDVYNQMAVAWAAERLSRGPSGTLPLLVAGFLIGQGLFLLGRLVWHKIGPFRAERLERLGAWDPGLKLATRFGLHQYLQRCTEWATEDPTARTQSLAVFKIRGLGALNEKNGTHVTSSILRQVSAELRAASLPDNVAPVRRWLRQNFPRPLFVSRSRIPPPRYPARWSGATFALAFRELDAVQAVAIARDVSNWIRKEFSSLQVQNELSVSSVIVVGSPDVTARGLSRAAAEWLGSDSQSAQVRVLCDPADVRAAVISQLGDVEFHAASLDKRNPDEAPIVTKSYDWRGGMRTWGPAIGCLAAAGLLLRVTSGKVPTTFAYFPYPDAMTEFPVVDQSGSTTVHLKRTVLAIGETNNWRLTDGLVVQGNPTDGPLVLCQIRIAVTNRSATRFYVSSFDFKAVDEKGRRLRFDPLRVRRMAQGLTGRWLEAGESWVGWMPLLRQDALIVGLEFEPDRFTRISLSGAEQATASESSEH